MPVKSQSQEIKRSITELWWLWVIQSIVAILFGIVALFWPGLTLVTLIYLVAPFIIAIGLIEIIRSLMSVGHRDTWWMSLIVGLLTLGAGVFLARHPNVTFATFVLVVGITFIAWGVTDLSKAFLDSALIKHRALTFIAGLAGIVAGIIILVQPVSGGLAFVWVIGLFALINGTMSLAMAIDQHKDYQLLKDSLDST